MKTIKDIKPSLSELQEKAKELQEKAKELQKEINSRLEKTQTKIQKLITKQLQEEYNNLFDVYGGKRKFFQIEFPNSMFYSKLFYHFSFYAATDTHFIDYDFEEILIKKGLKSKYDKLIANLIMENQLLIYQDIGILSLIRKDKQLNNQLLKFENDTLNKIHNFENKIKTLAKTHNLPFNAIWEQFE